MKLFNWFRDRQLNQIVEDLVSRDEKCQELIARIESTYKFKMRPLNLNSISSYFLIDMLERAFTEGNIHTLPSETVALDVGIGKWRYAPALLAFLKSWKESRKVYLGGIDFPSRHHKKSVIQLQEKWDLDVHWNDVMDLNQESKYDIIFLIHMLSGPRHCRSFKVPYHRPSSMFPHIQSLGKPSSLLVVVAYTWAGESAIINYFARESRLTEFVYWPQIGKELISVAENRFGFHDNRICISKSPYVDLEACKEQEKETEEWDALLDKTLGH